MNPGADSSSVRGHLLPSGGATRAGVVCLSLALLGVGCSATLRRPSAREYRQQDVESFEKGKVLDASDQDQEWLDRYSRGGHGEVDRTLAWFGRRGRRIVDWGERDEWLVRDCGNLTR